MKALVADRMELKLVKNCQILLIPEKKIYDEGLRSISKSLKLLCIYCKKYIINAVTVKHARNESLATEGFETYDSMGWLEVQHFFIAPYYMISYCVSNDLALQVYALEQETAGAGLTKYTDMLYTSAGATLLAFAETNGLTSPFAEGRVAALADFLEAQLK